MSSPLPPFKSSPMAALQAAFQSPNWVGNILWLTLAAVTSSIFIGNIALFGYGAELLEGRRGRPENPPMDVDSNRLGDYISKGIWPFLVSFVAQMALGFLMMIPFGVFFGIVAAAGASGGDEAAGITAIILMPMMALLAGVGALFAFPFLIRAMVTQDFARAFDFGWCMSFVRIMWAEMLVSGIVFWLLSTLIILAGWLTCILGLPATGVVLGGQVNLLAQWYEIFLSRGGEAPPGPILTNAAGDVIDATIVE